MAGGWGCPHEVDDKNQRRREKQACEQAGKGDNDSGMHP